MVLLHGLALSRRRWKKQIEPLVAAGFRVTRIDFRGFGDSDTPPGPYDISRLADDVRSAVEQLGLARFHLVGHSLGGMVALRHAIDHPEQVRSLTLAASAARITGEDADHARDMAESCTVGFDEMLANPRLRAAGEKAIAVTFEDPPPIESFRHWTVEPQLPMAWAWAATVGFSVEAELGAITCPVLVMHGTGDPQIPARLGEEIHRAIPGSRYVVFDGICHWMHVDQPERFNAELLRFLDGVEAVPPAPQLDAAPS